MYFEILHCSPRASGKNLLATFNKKSVVDMKTPAASRCQVECDLEISKSFAEHDRISSARILFIGSLLILD